MHGANMKNHCMKLAMSLPMMSNWRRSMHAVSTMNLAGWRWSLCRVKLWSRSLSRNAREKCMTTTRIDDAALFAVLSSLADNKQAIGRRYAYWSNGAPALEAAVAAAAMTQDELGHTRTLYPLLEDFVQAEQEPQQ